MLEVQPKDSRGYFMLPQAPEDAGYYVYGTPDQGGGQYAHPDMLTTLFSIERQWQTIDYRKFGIGNISLSGGGRFKPHGSHKNGLQVDIRPLRKDGAHVPVNYFQAGYDKEATARLIGLFRAHPAVMTVYFNDLSIPGVLPMVNHDNHFHVAIRAGTS
jgi:penicillin-insensitive murein DD-endopeptidase